MRKALIIISYILAFSLMADGCGSVSATVSTSSLDVSSASELIEALDVSAPGTSESRSDEAVIDYSNTSEGYVMVDYLIASDRLIKAQVKGPETTYTYSIEPEVWAAFPLSDGDGFYTVTILDNVAGSKYAMVLSADFDVTLNDEFEPFLRPNQYVNFSNAPLSVAMAAELTKDCVSTLDKVASVYEYVIKNLTYDYDKAMSVSNGYLPDLDDTLESKKGICFDYASLMTGMLRSLGIPCKLVVGYAGDAYHAWISVYVDGQGWIDNLVYFDGTSWQFMDPTFASASSDNREFIGDGSNYSAKYFY